MNDFKAFKLIKDKIAERESKYQQTWKKPEIRDLITVARLKTYRAETMLEGGEKEKLLDDLIDAAAYLIFAIERVV